MRIKSVLLLTLVLFFLTSLPANAFGISPVKMLLTVEPGANQTVVLKITNKEEVSLAFKLSVLGVKQDETGLPVFNRDVEEAENWVYPEDNMVQVIGGETKSVNFIIKVPAEAEVSSHYLGLAAEQVIGDNNKNSLNSRLISLLTLQVKGVVHEELFIEKWGADPTVSTNRDYTFNLKLRNSGVVEVPMRAVVAIRNWRGEEIFSEPIVLGNKLLAGSRRALSPLISLKDDLDLPGLYQAQLTIHYGLTNQTTSAIAHIWYFPKWSQVAAVIFGLVIMYFFVVLVKRKK